MVALEARFGLDIPDEDISYFTGTAAISAYLSAGWQKSTHG
jgi:acyl carrier protein